MEPVLIRPAVPDDYEQAERIMQQVHALHLSWRPDIYNPCAPVLPRPEFLEAVAGQRLLVAETDGKAAGILLYLHRHIESENQVAREVLFIETLAIDAGYRGRGIGRQLLQAAAQIAREKGYDGVELQVNAKNTDAFAFYKKYGFTEKSINMELPGFSSGR